MLHHSPNTDAYKPNNKVTARFSQPQSWARRMVMSTCKARRCRTCRAAYSTTVFQYCPVAVWGATMHLLCQCVFVPGPDCQWHTHNPMHALICSPRCLIRSLVPSTSKLRFHAARLLHSVLEHLSMRGVCTHKRHHFRHGLPKHTSLHPLHTSCMWLQAATTMAATG